MLLLLFPCKSFAIMLKWYSCSSWLSLALKRRQTFLPLASVQSNHSQTAYIIYLELHIPNIGILLESTDYPCTMGSASETFVSVFGKWIHYTADILSAACLSIKIYVKSLHILAHMEQWESILRVSMPAFTWKWGFSHSVIPYKDIMHSWPLNVVAVHVKYYNTHAILSHIQLVMPSCKHFKAVVFQNWSFRGTIKAAMLWMTFQRDTDLQQYPYMTCPLPNLTVAL